MSMAAAWRAALLVCLACLALTLQGCGSSSGGDATTTTTTTSTSSTSSTSTTYVESGQCSDSQRKERCASGFCNASACECMPNFAQTSNAECELAKSQKTMTFYMYRAMDENHYDESNDNLGSLSGVLWYLHNEVVIQSCPRKNNIVRIQRVKVTMRNSDKTFAIRSTLFGEYVNFAAGTCGADCTTAVFDKYGYSVGCEFPADAQNYTWNGYSPVWYSLPGSCPQLAQKDKTDQCKVQYTGGQCIFGQPDGVSCTYTLSDVGSVNITEFYGPDFDYETFCKQGGREYVRSSDKGTSGVSFWDDKNSVVANAKRVQKLRELFAARTEGSAELPEPWCDWQSPLRADSEPVNI